MQACNQVELLIIRARTLRMHYAVQGVGVHGAGVYVSLPHPRKRRPPALRRDAVRGVTPRGKKKRRQSSPSGLRLPRDFGA